MLSRGENIRRGMAVLAASGALAVSAWRIQLGVDLTDEAFYVALPYRFALGDRPFVDELNVAQTSGILLWPFVKAYVALMGSTGIFLFLRILYLALFSIVGVAVMRLARTRVSFAAAVLIGAVCVTCIPYGVPGLSYNTVALAGLTLGQALTGRWLLQPENTPHGPLYRQLLVWSGFAHAVAAFAHPIFGAVAVCSVLPLVALAPARARLFAFSRFVMGGVIFILMLAPTFISAGASHLRETITYSSTTLQDSQITGTVSYDLDHFITPVKSYWDSHPEAWKLFAAVGLAAILFRKRPIWKTAAIVAVPLFARATAPVPLFAAMGFWSMLAFVAPVLALVVRDRRAAKVLIFGAWLPSAFAALLMAGSSGNRAAVTIGLFPGAITSLILLSIWAAEAGKSLRAFSFVPQLAPLLSLLVMLDYETTEGSIYREDAIASLTVRVPEGPYKGLRTSRHTADRLKALRDDIRKYRRGTRALFYYDLPAGYLFAEQRPLVSSAWIFPIPGRTAFEARDFRRKAAEGNLVVRIGARTRWGTTELDKAVDEYCEFAGQHGELSVYYIRYKNTTGDAARPQ